jgi:hypothetical protein
VVLAAVHVQILRNAQMHHPVLGQLVSITLMDFLTPTVILGVAEVKMETALAAAVVVLELHDRRERW